MPRPGDVGEPEFQRGDSLPYGAATAANAMEDAVPSFLGELPFMDEGDDEFVPSGPEEAFLASPTDMPEMPLSAGSPFGPGAPGTTPRIVSDQAFLRDAIARMPVQDLPPRLQGFLRRAEAGE